MVVVMVGMNYKLKRRKRRKMSVGEVNDENEGHLRNSSSVSFTEGRGTFSTLVSESKKCAKVKEDV